MIHFAKDITWTVPNHDFCLLCVMYQVPCSTYIRKKKKWRRTISFSFMKNSTVNSGCPKYILDLWAMKVMLLYTTQINYRNNLACNWKWSYIKFWGWLVNNQQQQQHRAAKYCELRSTMMNVIVAFFSYPLCQGPQNDYFHILMRLFM